MACDCKDCATDRIDLDWLSQVLLEADLQNPY